MHARRWRWVSRPPSSSCVHGDGIGIPRRGDRRGRGGTGAGGQPDRGREPAPGHVRVAHPLGGPHRRRRQDPRHQGICDCGERGEGPVRRDPCARGIRRPGELWRLPARLVPGARRPPDDERRLHGRAATRVHDRDADRAHLVPVERLIHGADRGRLDQRRVRRRPHPRDRAVLRLLRGARRPQDGRPRAPAVDAHDPGVQQLPEQRDDRQEPLCLQLVRRDHAERLHLRRQGELRPAVRRTRVRGT